MSREPRPVLASLAAVARLVEAIGPHVAGRCDCPDASVCIDEIEVAYLAVPLLCLNPDCELPIATRGFCPECAARAKAGA